MPCPLINFRIINSVLLSFRWKMGLSINWLSISLVSWLTVENWPNLILWLLWRFKSIHKRKLSNIMDKSLNVWLEWQTLGKGEFIDQMKTDLKSLEESPKNAKIVLLFELLTRWQELTTKVFSISRVIRSILSINYPQGIKTINSFLFFTYYFHYLIYIVCNPSMWSKIHIRFPWGFNPVIRSNIISN